MSRPTVSINLCCYNSERFLRDTLESIQRQTYRDWELVIVNDGSTDSTDSIIQDYFHRGMPIIYHVQENQGLPMSRNTALQLSHGEFIALIDHDDLWEKDKLERQLPLFKNPSVAIVYSNATVRSGSKERLYLPSRCLYRGSCFGYLLRRDFMALPTVVLRHSAVRKLDYMFEPDYHVVEDHDLLLRLAYQWEVDYIDAPLATWRISSQGSSWRNRERFSNEHAAMLLKYRESFSDLDRVYGEDIKYLESTIAYERALVEWARENQSAVRKLIFPHLLRDKRLIVSYLFSFFPFYVYLNFLRLLGRYPAEDVHE